MAEASKQTTQKKSAAKKSPAKKTPAKKTPAKKAGRAPRAEAPRRRTGPQVAAEAVRQLGELLGKDAEAVTGLSRTDDGWRVEVDVLELRRVPSTTDVLATYEIETDESGELEGYRRTRRYVRGQAEGDQ